MGDATASIVVVPDGTNGTRLRLSLQLSPRLVAGGPADLGRWPETILDAVSKSLTLFTAPVTGKVDAPAIGKPTPLAADKPTLAAKTGAVDLWKRIFPNLTALREALDNLGTDQPEPPAAHAAASFTIAPRVDVAMVEKALLDARLEHAADNIERLRGSRGPARLTSFHEKRMRAIRLWAVPDVDDLSPSGLGFSEAEAARAKVATALPATAAGKTWRRFDHNHARLDAIHRADLLAGRFDPDLAAAVAATRPQTLDERLRAELMAVQDEVAIDPETDPSDADQPLPWADERRKLAAIHSFPSVSRLLGMTIDIEIDDSVGRYGAIAATLGTPPDDQTCWTAFANHKAASRLQSGLPLRYFGPCDIAEAYDQEERAEHELIRGVLNLRQPGTRGGNRYSLSIVNVAAGALQEIQQARRAAAQASGDTDPPDISGRGIALVDADRDAADQRAKERRDYLLDPKTKFKLHFAADLLEGLRPSVGVASDQATPSFPTSDRWRSLVERSIGYQEPAVTGSTTPLDRQREAGFVRKMTGEQLHIARTQPSASRVVIRQPEELFVWTGDSLAVAARDERLSGEDGNPPSGEILIPEGRDLPIGMTFRLPPRSASTGLAPLREGACYMFGVSAAFVNGCGWTAQEASTAYTSFQSLCLGDLSTSAPFRFVRVERVPAPVVLLPADDEPLVWAKDITSLRGEGLMTLAIRDGRFGGPKNRRRPPRRYLFPERVNFDRAEQQRQFDKVTEPVPSGCFSDDRIDVEREEIHGSFPLAIDGRILFPSPTTGASTPARGSVLQFAAPHSSPRRTRPYYADAYTVGATAAPKAIVPSNAELPRVASAAFRKADRPAREALPAIIELRPLQRPLPGGARVRALLETEDVYPVEARLQKIVFELAKGTVIDVTIAADVDRARFASSHYLRALLAGKTSSGVSQALAEKALASILGSGVWTDLQGPHSLRLVHAVEKPGRPDFTGFKSPPPVSKDLPESGLATVIFSETPASADESSRAPTAWTEYVAAHADHALAEWQGQPGGATCFFVGKLVVDGATTGTLNAYAHWLEFGPEAVVLSAPAGPPGSKRWTFAPPMHRARMFSVGDVPSDLHPRHEVDRSVGKDHGELVTLVDLIRDSECKARKLSYSFPDGRARKLNVDLVAASRYLDYYPPGGLTDGVDAAGRPTEGRCEARSERSLEIWAPCSFRPAAPDVRRMDQHFLISGTNDVDRGIFTFERRTVLRIEMGPGCFASGEGERLALAFNANPPGNVCAYLQDESLRPFAGFVTRWGSDPFANTPVPSVELVPGHFMAAGDPAAGELAGPFELYPGADPSTEESPNPKVLPIAANIVSYEIRFDEVLGTFYADVPIEPGAAGLDADGYMPFVQLGLALYQPHCIAGLELSPPIGKLVQPLPHRKGKLEFKRGSYRLFRLTLDGPLPDVGKDSPQHWLELTLMHRPGINDDPSFIPASRDHLSGFISWKLAPEVVNGVRRWDTGWLDCELNTRTRHLGLLIEEYEEISMTDSSTSVKSVSRRLLFGHTIDFGDRGR